MVMVINGHIRKGQVSRDAPVVFLADGVLEREELRAVIHGAGWRIEPLDAGNEAFAEANDLVPSCLVLDAGGPHLRLPLAPGGTDVPIIWITSRCDVPMTVRAMKAGAIDVLTKPVRADALVDAVGRALNASTAALRRAQEMRHLRGRYGSLSLRERQVMTLVASGLLNKQVGGELGISEVTVKAHRGKVMRKMNAQSLAHLVAMAASLQLAHAAS
jgi:FixJ family two-component response regulator